MNKNEVQERIAAINQEMLATKANYNKLEGHLQECNHWLMEIIKEETQQQVKDDKEKLDAEANNNAEEQAACEELCGAE